MHARITTLSIIRACTHGHRKNRRPSVHAHKRSPAARTATATARTFQTTKKPILHLAQGPTDGYTKMVPVNHQSELERLFHQNRVSQNCLVGFLSTAVASKDRITRTYQSIGFSSYIGCWLQFLPMQVPSNSQNCLVGFSTSVA